MRWIAVMRCGRNLRLCGDNLVTLQLGTGDLGLELLEVGGCAVRSCLGFSGRLLELRQLVLAPPLTCLLLAVNARLHIPQLLMEGPRSLALMHKSCELLLLLGEDFFRTFDALQCLDVLLELLNGCHVAVRLVGRSRLHVVRRGFDALELCQLLAHSCELLRERALWLPVGPHPAGSRRRSWRRLTRSSRCRTLSCLDDSDRRTRMALAACHTTGPVVRTSAMTGPLRRA